MALNTIVCREAMKVAVAAVHDKTDQDAILDAMIGAILDHILTFGVVTVSGVQTGGGTAPGSIT